jgi:hypothetical protein
MKTISKMGAQGDVMFRRVERVPEGFARVERKGRLVVAHSETGHHHAIDDVGVVQFNGTDQLRCYLMLESVETADVVHHRSFDTHETVSLGGGIGAVWEVIRQREWAPEGWRRVED